MTTIGTQIKNLPRHTGEVPPEGAEGEGRSRSARQFPIMAFHESPVRLSPSGPTGHLPRMTTGKAREP
jgi:hypothetical protein